jgi:peptide/nickel transport system substrate-binding protein
MRHSLECVGALLMTSLALSACGGSSHSSPRAGRSTPTVVTTTDDNISPISPGQDPYVRGPVTVPGANAGGTITVLSHHALWAGLDPTAASTPDDAVSILSGLVTRSLTQYVYDAKTQLMHLVPDLALDLGRHNDDYTRWDFTIRHRARFEDGTRVTAWAVARGIRRCRQTRRFPTSPCRGVPILSVRVRRHDTVDVLLRQPYPDFPYLGALPALGPIPRGGGTDTVAYRRHPLATGPYRIRSFRRGSRLVLTRNPQWDAVSDPGRTQYPAEYDFRLGLSSHRITHLLLGDQGAAQRMLTYDTLRPQSWLASKARTRRLVRGATPCTTYLAPDNRVVTDARVRRALIWAFPYRAMMRLERLTPGVTAVPATNLLPPGISGRRPLGVRGHPDFATEPRVARGILARAGALGSTLPFAYDPGTRTGVRIRALLLGALRRAGFTPRAVPPGSGPVDLSVRTWCGAWPHGSAWLVPVYQPQAVGGAAFEADAEHFSSRYVDARVSAIQHVPLEQMDSLWGRLDRTVLQRWQPIVPLWYAGVAMAHGSRIEGMADDTTVGMPTWKQLWVSP